MIRSMTGYGRVQMAAGGYNILFEIKSVNHRFYEFSARVPRLYGYIEEKLRAYLQSFISRGKVDVFVSVEPTEAPGEKIVLNEPVALAYITALRELAERYGLKDDVTVSAVSRFNDIFTVTQLTDDEQKVWACVKNAADKAVAEFLKMRETEGERLKKDLTARAAHIAELVETVERRSPETVDEFRAKLTARLKELLADVKTDDSRILMEAALYADKISVTEETVRLRSHLRQFAQMLESSEPVGRKLDFLMQELNREANTIGSKAQDVDIARTVVEIKAELEKIREQIQNIE